MQAQLPTAAKIRHIRHWLDYFFPAKEPAEGQQPERDLRISRFDDLLTAIERSRGEEPKE